MMRLCAAAGIIPGVVPHSTTRLSTAGESSDLEVTAVSITSSSLAKPQPSISSRIAAGQITWGWPVAMVVGRTVMFGLWQGLFALILALQGNAAPWEASIAWWPITAILTNIVCLVLLYRLTRREGIGLRAVFGLEPHRIGREILICLGLVVASAPVTLLGSVGAGLWLFGDSQQPLDMFLRPLPVWAAALSLVLFPVTIALAELPTYYGYAMPRLAALSGRRWLAVGVTAFFLSAQHCALPLIFDTRFLAWRFAMFLPSAIVLALIISWRPRQLPYLMVIHGLMDLQIAWMLLAMALA
jgi:hypothetical protein